MIDLIHFNEERVDDIVSDQLEIRMSAISESEMTTQIRTSAHPMTDGSL